VSDYEVATTETVHDRRLPVPVIATIAVVATIAVLLLVIRPLFAGGEPQAIDEPATLLAAAQEDEDADTDVAADEIVELPLVTHDVYLSRDPFDPVVPEPVVVAAADPATEGTATDGTATDGAVTDGTTDPADPNTSPDPAVPPVDGATAPGPGDPPPPAGCTTGDTVSCDGRIVALVEVRGSGADAVAIIQVDTTLYEVRTGDTFAGAFQLSSISGSCVNVLYGDDAFPLCEGDRTLK
jgi:hypothetical protein